MTGLLRVALVPLLLATAGCGGDSGSAPPPIGGTPTASPSPSPSPTPSPTPTGVVLTPNIPYGSGSVAGGSIPLLLDVHQPAGACTTPRPTVMFVHGGGFVGGSRKGGNVDAIAAALAQRGINLLSIDYRLEGNNPVISPAFAQFESDYRALNAAQPAARATAFTAAVEDGLQALKWIEANAGSYCIDPNRLGVWGSSAGAYTVLHIAYALDEYAIARPALRVVVDYWGGLFRDSDLDAGELPLFVLHGTADPTVPYSEATELATRAETVGVPLTFYTITGGTHGFDGSGFFEVKADGEAIASKTAAFVEAHLKDGGQPVYERRSLPR